MKKNHSFNELEIKISELENELRLLKDKRSDKGSFHAQILEDMNCAVVAFDLQAKVVEWNKEAVRILGWERAEVVGQPVWTFVTSFEGEKSTQKLIDEFLTGKVTEGRTVLLSRMKKEIPVYCTVRPLKDSDGKVVGFFETMKDISSEEEHAKKLKKSKKDFQLLFNEMNSAFALHKMIYDEDGTPINYRFIQVNKMFEKLTGLEAKDIIGKTVLEVMPNTEKYWIDVYGKVAKTKEPIEYRNYSTELGRHYDVRAYCPQKDYFATTFIDVSIRYNYEQYLNRNKLFYENILETLNHSVWVINKENQVVYVNQSFSRVFNFDKSEVIGKDITTFSSNCFGKIKTFQKKAIKEKTPVNFNTECKLDNGQVRIVSGWILPSFEDQLFESLICIVEDLTDIKRTEKELEESRERLSAQYQYFPLPVYTFEYQDGDFVLIEVNKATYDETHGQVEKILGIKVSELWNDEPQLIDIIHDCYKNRKINEVEREYKFRSTQKESFVKATYGYVPPRYVLVTTEDITERKKSEHAIREAEKLFSFYVDNINAYVFIKDVDSKYIFINKETEELFNIKREDLKAGKHDDFDFFEPEAAERNRANDVKVMNSGQACQFEDELKPDELEDQSVDIKRQYFTSLKFPLKDEDGKIIGLCGFALDISRRKKMEKELLFKNKELEETVSQIREMNEKLNKARLKAVESDRLKSAFLANMSHEIRTPMNSIVGFSGLLAESGISEEKRLLYSNLISSSSEHLLRIINDIIDIAKIESNQLTIEKSWCNLSDTLLDIYTFHKQGSLLSGKKDVELKLNIENVPDHEMIYTDQVRFKQVFDNLITNAIKNTSSGVVEFGVYELDKEDPDEMVFFVKDTGYGIPKRDQKTIFRRFTQLESPSLKAGTGLGLSIITGIIKLMKGKIWLESVEGAGTTFYFSIPFRTQFAQESTSIAMDDPIVPKIDGRLVYVADKDVPSYLYLKEVLSQTGAIVKHVVSKQDLQRLIEEQTPDLLFFDIDSSVFGGRSAITKIRKQKMFFPIIIQTSYADNKERNKYLKAGGNDYISKPIDIRVLYEMISRLLIGSR